MIHWFRNIALYVVFAIASVAIAQWIGSTVTRDLLIPNLMAIVIALLAINVQTVAIISVKLRELADKHGFHFKATVTQFRLALYEQATLVLASLALNTLAKSAFSDSWPLAIDIGAFFVLFAALHIFVDTSIGLLVAIFPDDENS